MRMDYLLTIEEKKEAWGKEEPKPNARMLINVENRVEINLPLCFPL